jgi:putative endonuclease
LNKHCVYILISNKGRRYIGSTSNIEQRISQHNRRHKGFTGTKEKWELEIAVECESINEARKLELKLKSLKNSNKAIDFLKKAQG